MVESLVQIKRNAAKGAEESKKSKSRYLALLGGPLLFTASHSGQVNRGGEEYGDKRRLNLREKYTVVLAMRFALETQKATQTLGSFCVWSKEHKLKDTDEDPNFLLSGRESRSPFHRMLHAWILNNPGKPLLHVNIHGKTDRKDGYELDLGV